MAPDQTCLNKTSGGIQQQSFAIPLPIYEWDTTPLTIPRKRKMCIFFKRQLIFKVSWSKTYWRYLDIVTKAVLGTLDITGPSRDHRARISEICHDGLAPILIPMYTCVEGLMISMCLEDVEGEAEASDVHTESKSVTIRAVESFTGSLQRARRMA